MYTAVANVKVTPAYWEALMKNPDSDRAAAIATAMASVGGKLHFFGFTHGKWDAIFPGKLPLRRLSCLLLLVPGWQE